MQLTMSAKKVGAVAALIGMLGWHSLIRAEVFTWQGSVSSDMADSANWLNSPTLDFLTGDDQWIFGPTTGSTTPQLAAGDGSGRSWVGQSGSGVVNTAILFDVGAPAFTFGDNGVATRSIGMWTDQNLAGSADVVNNSGNTQTFNVIFRTRIGTIDARAGDIVFNNTFRPGDGQNSTAQFAIFQGDDNIYLNGPVVGHTNGGDRTRVIYRGASTTAENAGKLILGDIGTAYNSRIVVDSQRGGAVVATRNTSFGDATYSSGGPRDTFIGNPLGGTGALSSGVVEIDGTVGDLIIPENFRVETRAPTGAPHVRNTAGNNTINGYLVTDFNGAIGAGDDSLIIESASGKLTLNGGVAANEGIVTRLYLQGAANGEIGPTSLGDGVTEDAAGSQISLIKRGSGDWSIRTGTSNRYLGTTMIEDGKFFMNGTHTTAGAADYSVSTGATLGGHGTIGSVVNVAGSVAPGEADDAIGTLTVGGLNLNGATLTFDLNAADHTAGSNINDLIVSTGLLDLSGGATLNVNGIGGNLTAGDYDLIQFSPGMLTGTASNLALGSIPLSAGLAATILIDADSVNLRVATSQAGDVDGDGDVDGGDFAAWQDNFPTASGAGVVQGDADGDGDVDGADFVVWQTNFPTAAGGSASPVPEPSAIYLIVLASLGIVVRRRFG